MMKKLSTFLTVGLLFGASLSASANYGGEASIVNGGTYLLNTSSGAAEERNYLFVSGGSLVVVNNTAYNAMLGWERAYGQWTISYKTNTAGSYEYTYVNKATGATLSLPTARKAYAHNAEGLNAFGWQADPTTLSEPAVLFNASVKGAQYRLVTVYTLTENVNAGSTTTFGEKLFTGGADAKGYGHLEVVTWTDMTDCSTCPAELVKGNSDQPNKNVYNALVKIRAAFELQNISTTYVDAYIAACESLAAGVADNDRTNNDVSEGSALEAAIKNAHAGLKKQIDALNEYWKSGVVNYAVANNSDGSTTREYDVPVGTYYVSNNNMQMGGDGTAASKTMNLKKGTRFIVASSTGSSMSAPVTVAPFLVSDASFYNSEDADVLTKITDWSSSGYPVASEKEGKSLIKSFVSEFKMKTQKEDSTTVITFDFEKMSSNIKNNPLAGKQFQIVERNLLVGDDGSIENAKNAGKTHTNYSKAVVLKEYNKNNYLVIKPTQLEENTSSTY